jgi:N-6 DNA Methylase
MAKKKKPSDEEIARSYKSQHERIRDHSAEIVKIITGVYDAFNWLEIFRKWVTVCHLALDGLPDNLRHAAAGEPLQDSPELAAQYQAAIAGLKPKTLDAFARAFAVLLDATDHYSGPDSGDGALSYADVLGSVYMEMISGRGQKWNGQFFTPWPVASMMAKMIIGDVEAEWNRNVQAAIDESPFSMMGLHVERTPLAVAQLAIPALMRNGALSPIRILEPCVGSGIMLLAAANEIPRHLIDAGFVHFTGIDIDLLCCEMARLNFRIYGMGHCSTVFHGNALSIPWVKENVLWPDNELLAGHKQAVESGDKEKQEHFERGIELRRQSQLDLWDGLDDITPKQDEPSKTTTRKPKPRRVITVTEPANGQDANALPIAMPRSLFDSMEGNHHGNNTPKENEE